jgi:hypothetical protein
MRTMLNNAARIAGLAALGLMTACQGATPSTRLTVINESSSAVLVDFEVTGSGVSIEGESIDAAASRAFVLEHPGISNPRIRAGVRAASLPRSPVQWAELAGVGPFLVRVQGSASELRLVAGRDAADIRAQDLRPHDVGRLGAEPPVNPSRR